MNETSKWYLIKREASDQWHVVERSSGIIVWSGDSYLGKRGAREAHQRLTRQLRAANVGPARG